MSGDAPAEMPGCVNYAIDDARDYMAAHQNGAADMVILDDAWSRPKRCGGMGIEYPTHDFGVTKDLLYEIRNALADGGWLVADADDWLLPRLMDYLREEWGDVPAGDNSGFHGVGSVTLVRKDGEPDRSTPGQYGSTGGYSTVFACKKPKFDDPVQDHITEATNPFQIARRQHKKYGWGTVKPVAPYRRWIGDLCDDGGHIVSPCAGTAPAAIAAEQLEKEITCAACDIETEAKEAYLRRRQDETMQTALGGFINA
jgi:hypothetical protein